MNHASGLGDGNSNPRQMHGIQDAEYGAAAGDLARAGAAGFYGNHLDRSGQQQQQPTTHEQYPAQPTTAGQVTTGGAHRQGLSQPNQSSSLGPQSGEHNPLERHNSQYSDWMAPVAGTTVAGAGIAAIESNRRQHVNDNGDMAATTSNHPEGAAAGAAAPDVPEKSKRRSSPPRIDDGFFAAVNASAPSHQVDGTSTALHDHASSDGMADGELGSLESEGAHLTDSLFPKIVRHDTDMTISALHVPGKFP